MIGSLGAPAASSEGLRAASTVSGVFSKQQERVSSLTTGQDDFQNGQWAWLASVSRRTAPFSP